jgi:quercetin dioxygenase-like cupin family protein
VSLRIQYRPGVARRAKRSRVSAQPQAEDSGAPAGGPIVKPMGSALWFAGTRVIVHVTAADSGGRLGVWESDEPRGTALPLHLHANEDEQMIVLEGEVSVRLGDEAHRLVAGDTIALPRAVPHAHRVDSETARILTVATPGGFERLFLEQGTRGDAPPRRPRYEVLIDAVRKLGVQTLDE